MENNKNIKNVKAKKEYKCDCCGHSISVGKKYLRININKKGIFHFCNRCKDKRDFIYKKIEDPFLDYESYKEEEILSDVYVNEF